LHTEWSRKRYFHLGCATLESLLLQSRGALSGAPQNGNRRAPLPRERENLIHHSPWEQGRGANRAAEGAMLELNTKKFLRKFAVFSFLKTFGNGSDSSILRDFSGAEAVWKQGREWMTS